MTRLQRAWPALLLLAPCSALAHSPIKELGSFLNGILHPLLVPSHLLLLLALGLLIGRHDPARHQAAVLAFLLATVAGLAASQLAPVMVVPAVLLGMSMLLGLLLVTELAVSPILIGLAAAATGALLGMDSDPEVYSGKALTGALFGSGIGIYLLMLYPMGLADSLRHKHWQRIGIRVAGSWITASAVLVLTLQFAPLP